MNTTIEPSSQLSMPSQNERSRSALAVVIGSALEWYDFFLYILLVGSVMSGSFFPASDRFVAAVSAYATFAVGFIARPFGGLLLANLSDRFGRKRILVLILFMTGGSSFLIGLLPTYATIGVAAPLALLALRILQGVGAGAEFAVAAVYAVESGATARRGARGALPAMGVYAGMLLAAVVLAIVSHLTGSAFGQWGWRIPFLLSGVLLAAGWWIRRNLHESTVFDKAKTVTRHPTRTLLRNEWRGVLYVVGAQCAQAGLGFLYLTFTADYLSTKMGMPRSVALQATLVSAAVAVITAPFFGFLADRIGVRRVFIGALMLCLGAGFIYFPLLHTRNPWMIDGAMVLTIGIGVNALLAAQGALFSAQFPAAVRTSGVALGRELSTAVVGGLTPLVAVFLLKSYGATGVAALAVVLTLVSLTTLVFFRRSGDTLLADGRNARQGA
jgi:MHS family shikimate/dehydroshikimate transporter-like MFS transporter